MMRPKARKHRNSEYKWPQRLNQKKYTMHTLRTIFQKIDRPNPPDGLEERILRRIEVMEEKRLQNALLLTRIGRGISAAAFLAIGLTFGQNILASEFWQLASLLFTDASIVMNYFGEFIYSLLETLPALPIALILMPMLSFLLFQFWSFNIPVRRNHSLSFHNV